MTSAGDDAAATIAAFRGADVERWLEAVRAAVLRGDADAAERIAAAALAEHADSIDLAFAHAGLLRQLARDDEAGRELRALLDIEPGHTAAAFLFARLCRDHGRMCAAGQTLTRLFGDRPDDANRVIQAVELLDDCGRQREADALLDAAIAAMPDDPRLHAYGGVVALQLGDFDKARTRYRFALEHGDVAAYEWEIPHGLAMSQRYESAAHEDFAMLRAGLARRDLGDKARASLHFALGKALDDVGEVDAAAPEFEAGNAIMRRLAPWPRREWRRRIETRLAARRPPARCGTDRAWTPIFVVGVPRSGTTLVADRLARRIGARNRGELPWFLAIAERIDNAAATHASLDAAAEAYSEHLLQDDAPARWYLDKQAFNLLHVDRVLALFPDARIVHCRRDGRDAALSLWQQMFLARELDFSYDLADVASVMRDFDRIASRWHNEYPDAIRTVRYEDFVEDPESAADALARWIGADAMDAIADSSAAISTSSLWQTRQPVYRRAVGRWRAYERAIPALARMPI